MKEVKEETLAPANAKLRPRTVALIFLSLYKLITKSWISNPLKIDWVAD